MSHGPPQILHRLALGSYLGVCNGRLVTKQLATAWTSIAYDSTLSKYSNILTVKFKQFAINNCLNVHYPFFTSAFAESLVLTSHSTHKNNKKKLNIFGDRYKFNPLAMNLDIQILVYPLCKI
jgi:hypothetical protein